MIILLMAAAFAPHDEPAPPPMVAALAAWNECISTRLDEEDDGGRPRDIARRVTAACEPSAQAMRAAHRSWVEGSTLKPSEKRQSIRSVESSIKSMPKMIELMVKASRDD